MGNFFTKILVVIFVLIIFCMCVAGDISFPSVKSKYDDINLSENIYNAGVETVGESLETAESIVDNQNTSLAEKLYFNLPDFFEDIFSTIEEGLNSWEYEDMDVEGIKDDSKSLFEKFIDIFPYME